MTKPRHIAVIDIGKTNAKLALVDLGSLTEVVVVTRPNTVLAGPPWPHFDTEGHWAFLLESLGRFHRDHGVDAISITTHGACVALLDEAGALAAPILDYEHDGPDALADSYASLRPPFRQTGSPKLPGGLNVGAQLHWQFSVNPGLKSRTAHIVTYPQYWGHRLTGVIASDVTSIGCHTDLWSPYEGRFSELPERLSIADKIAPVRTSAEIMGPILPEIADATGLAPGTPVCVGLHDSNASLYPHLRTQSGAFSVVSTGTWVVVMSIGGAEVPLDPGRDTLVNVNAQGRAVPSARFMGGREYETIQAGSAVAPSDQDIADVLARSLMIAPAVDPLTGPFQGQTMRWIGPEPAVGSGRRAAALSFYLAMMTETCLTLTGAEGPVIVEGPFARNAQYTAMLTAATGRPVLVSAAATGTSIGAALLFADTTSLAEPSPVAEPETLSAMQAYAARWRLEAEAGRKDTPGR
ncbi:FGGY-family carbohydrate kinase [Flavimaricola marinus]|uniref:L-fuculokinase n=1 Tax=Flavimaricola marinus TaxID=1819565 RepID=A0A238L9N1_9RHOB|nr:FGGY-family carbohydrate kinase [Flavimaricola marinus]SMY06292.1 L-fuculokinase [Flavimaricola marinus]